MQYLNLDSFLLMNKRKLIEIIDPQVQAIGLQVLKSVTQRYSNKEHSSFTMFLIGMLVGDLFSTIKRILQVTFVCHSNNNMFIFCISQMFCSDNSLYLVEECKKLHPLFELLVFNYLKSCILLLISETYKQRNGSYFWGVLKDVDASPYGVKIKRVSKRLYESSVGSYCLGFFSIRRWFFQGLVTMGS